MGKLNESDTRTPFIRLQGSDGKHGHCYRGTRHGLTESLQLEGKHCAMFSKPSNVIYPIGRDLAKNLRNNRGCKGIALKMFDYFLRKMSKSCRIFHVYIAKTI